MTNCWFVEIPTGDRIMSGISLILVVFVFIMLNGLMKLLRKAGSCNPYQEERPSGRSFLYPLPALYPLSAASHFSRRTDSGTEAFAGLVEGSSSHLFASSNAG